VTIGQRLSHADTQMCAEILKFILSVIYMLKLFNRNPVTQISKSLQKSSLSNMLAVHISTVRCAWYLYEVTQ